MHKIKNRTAPSSFLQNVNSLLICIQHTFQVGIIENHKLNYTNVHFEFRLEVQQYERTLSGLRKKVTKASSLVKTKVKNKLLNFGNEMTFCKIHLLFKIHSQEHQ